MKIQLETIAAKVNRSFSVMFNPRMSDLFFWHYHPEYELVYIKNASGTRHVGHHISEYTESDLVLIGSNIPHLNFDYGVTSEYSKVVVHLKKDLVEDRICSTPELHPVPDLIDRAKFGISFKGEIKERIGEELIGFHQFSTTEQYIRLLQILHLLAVSADFELLHDQPYPVKFNPKKQSRLQKIYAFIDKNYHRKIELAEIAGICNMTKEAFCRYFKATSSYTFTDFLNRYRISQAKRMLMAGFSVGEACYGSGFESLSYFNRTFNKITSENPSRFRKNYLKSQH